MVVVGQRGCFLSGVIDFSLERLITMSFDGGVYDESLVRIVLDEEEDDQPLILTSTRHCRLWGCVLLTAPVGSKKA